MNRPLEAAQPHRNLRMSTSVTSWQYSFHMFLPITWTVSTMRSQAGYVLHAYVGKAVFTVLVVEEVVFAAAGRDRKVLVNVHAAAVDTPPEL